MKSEIKITQNRLEMTRIFNAPRAQVFALWKQAAKLQQWWGCKLTTQVESEIDFQVGGSFSHKMQISGVGEMTYTGVFDEIVEPERIVYHAEFGGIKARVTILFADLGDRTKLTLVQEGFPGDEFCQVVSEGFSAGFDRLDLMLVGELAQSRHTETV